MSVSLIFDFHNNLYEFLSCDPILSRMSCDVFISPKKDAKYPFIVINIDKFHRKENFHNFLIDGRISMFSRDRSNGYKILSRVENLINSWRYPLCHHNLISIKILDFKSIKSEDYITEKVDISFLSQISIKNED